jgi:hypothetical protein
MRPSPGEGLSAQAKSAPMFVQHSKKALQYASVIERHFDAAADPPRRLGETAPKSEIGATAHGHGFVMDNQIRAMLSKRLSGSGLSVPQSLTNIS